MVLKNKHYQTTFDSNGYSSWYKDRLCHRIVGPACIQADGTMFYYDNNKRHRIGGPAIIWSDGHEEWYENDKWIK